jgi:aminoglycoside phosphotransferase (APT) family kinase protein
LLQHLCGSGLVVPAPLLLDETCELLPEPWLLLGYLPGTPLLDPAEPAHFAASMARSLAQIHACDPAAMSGTLPDVHSRVEQLLARPSADARIRELFRRRGLPRARNPQRLLHGDFWPGNLLWQGPLLSGVIDWADAGLGDPLLDLSISRLELSWLLGEAVMHEFTRAYCEALPCDLSELPYWDLLAALRPGSKLAIWAEAWPDAGRPDVSAQSMREVLDAFVAQALACA